MSDEKGFLTDTDRAFLTGEKEYTGENAKQLRYQRRQAIAERTRQAFRDFVLLFEELDEHERQRAFDVPREDHSDFRDGVESTIAFLYTGAKDDVNSTPAADELPMPSFEALLNAGVSKAETARHSEDISPKVHVDVTFSVDVTPPTVHDQERLVEKLARFKTEDLSESDARFALDMMTRDSGGLGKAVKQRREELGLQEPKVLGAIEDDEVPSDYDGE